MSVNETELVDNSLVKAWARWALVWLTFFPLVGVLVSIQFHNPEHFLCAAGIEHIRVC